VLQTRVLSAITLGIVSFRAFYRAEETQIAMWAAIWQSQSADGELNEILPA